MRLSKLHCARLTELLDALREQQLTDDETAELETLVLGSDVARRLYLQATGLCASLHWMHNHALGEAATASTANSRPPTAAGPAQAALRFLSRPTPFSITVAALVVGLLVTSLAFLAAPIYRKLSNANSPAPRAVARLTSAHQAHWAQAERSAQGGDFLLAGDVLQLESGLAELTFNSGAVVVLEGPAELRILSEQAARLAAGKLFAQVPPPAVGFTIHTPVADAKDLGTEFGVSVAADGQTEIGVYQGRVEVRIWRTGAGASDSPRPIVSSGEMIRIAADGRQLRGPLAEQSQQFARGMSPRPGELPVSDEYVRTVIDAQPAAYWRFDDVQRGIVANQMSDRHRLHNDGVGFHDVGEGNLAALFPRDGTARHLQCDDMDALAGDAYSVELWAQPFTSGGGHLAMAALGRAAIGDSLLVSISGAADQQAAIRFLHRSPAGITGGVDVYSSGDCAPAEWHHVAAVKQQGRLSLYLDGKLVGEGEGAKSLDPSARHFFIGRLRTDAGGDGRQFVGRLDEIAIYNRALSADEIARRYRLLRGFP